MITKFREKYYVCGDYIEYNLYPVYKKSSSRRKKANPTKECQRKVNAMNAENKLIRLVNTNFTSEDYKVELTYKPENHPNNDDDASANIRNFLRRLKNYRRKQGLEELKYIAVTEKGTKKGRYHHHLIINGGFLAKELVRIWGLGIINCVPLQFNENGIADLARYMMKKSVASKKRWNASKNLKQPIMRQRDGRLSKRRVTELARDTENRREYEKCFEGYYLSEARRIYNDINGGIYIYARFYSKEAEFCSRITNRLRK